MFCFIGKHPLTGVTENRFFNNNSWLAASAPWIKCNQLASNS